MDINRATKIAHKQDGIALISVLLVFALVTILAAEIASRNYMDIRKTSNFLSSKQAYYYALSGEQYARQLLYRDYMDSGGAKGDRADSLTDNWSNLKKGFDIDNGEMTITIVDLQSLFNLNSLRSTNGSVNKNAAIQFSRLLSALNVNRDYSALLADWIDLDSNKSIGGAEDSTYREKGYLAANIAMSDRSELRLLDGFERGDYNIIKDYVVALPSKSESRGSESQQNSTAKYNINTLDAKLIEAISPGVSNDEISSINRIQQSGGYNSVNEWLNSAAGSNLNGIKDQLSVESEYFEVRVQVNFSGRISTIRTQFYRNMENGEIEVIKRQQQVLD